MDTVLMISSWDCDQFSIFNLLCREITLSTVITLIMEDRKEFLSYLISTDTCFGWPFINSLCGSEWLYPRRLVSLLQSHCCFINLKWDLYVQWDLELQPVRNEMFPLILPQGELVGNLSLTSDTVIHCAAMLGVFWEKSGATSAGAGIAHVNQCHHSVQWERVVSSM